SRVQVIERTVPEDGEALARAYEEHRIEGEHLARVHESYAELVDQAAPLAQRHECYVGIKVDLRRQAAWREAKRRGQGDTLRGALLVLFEELSVLSEALSAAAAAGLRRHAHLQPHVRGPAGRDRRKGVPELGHQ